MNIKLIAEGIILVAVLVIAFTLLHKAFWIFAGIAALYLIFKKK